MIHKSTPNRQSCSARDSRGAQVENWPKLPQIYHIGRGNNANPKNINTTNTIIADSAVKHTINKISY